MSADLPPMLGVVGTAASCHKRLWADAATDAHKGRLFDHLVGAGEQRRRHSGESGTLWVVEAANLSLFSGNDIDQTIQALRKIGERALCHYTVVAELAGAVSQIGNPLTGW
jgi:hypothetical protein